MKIYLFLYPITPFFENEIQNSGSFRSGKYDARRLNDIIRARYRKNGYQIVWLLFGEENSPQNPDTKLLVDWIAKNPEDMIISTGVSFREHTANRIYPEPAFILGQIPDITEIVMGGFHQWDCVNKLASFAYNLGIPVRVDEETTELFFAFTGFRGLISLIRSKPLTLKEIFGNTDFGLDDAISARAGMPWFMQT